MTARICRSAYGDSHGFNANGPVSLRLTGSPSMIRERSYCLGLYGHELGRVPIVGAAPAGNGRACCVVV